MIQSEVSIHPTGLLQDKFERGDKTRSFTFQLVLQHNVAKQLFLVAHLRDSLFSVTFQAKWALCFCFNNRLTQLKEKEL